SVLRLNSVDEIYYRPFSRQIQMIHQTIGFDLAIVSYVYFSKAFEAFGETTYKVLDTHDSFSEELPSPQEVKGFLRADCVLAAQEEEAAFMRKQLGREAGRVRVLSHILDTSTRISVDRTAGATFLGSSFDANIVSLRCFVVQVLPIILEMMPSFRLFIAGTI